MSEHEIANTVIAAMNQNNFVFHRDQFTNKIIECLTIKQERILVKHFGKNSGMRQIIRV